MDFSISVLIPVYNSEKYIEKCLESLFANSIAKKCEFIIVNDCSPDNVFEIAKNMVERFPSIAQNVVFYSHAHNCGIAASRNSALKLAHAEYILYVDSDDWVEPDYLEKMYNSVSDNTADIAICGYFEEWNSRQTVCIPKTDRQAKNEIYEDFISDKIQGYCWNKIIKKSLFINNDISFVEGINIWEDVLVLSQIFFYATKINFVSEPLYHYRKRNTASISNSMTIQKYEQLLFAMNSITKFLVEKKIWEDYRNLYLKRCVIAKLVIIRKLPKKIRPYNTLFSDEEKLYISDKKLPPLLHIPAIAIKYGFYSFANFIYALAPLLMKQ